MMVSDVKAVFGLNIQNNIFFWALINMFFLYGFYWGEFKNVSYPCCKPTLNKMGVLTVQVL